MDTQALDRRGTLKKLTLVGAAGALALATGPGIANADDDGRNRRSDSKHMWIGAWLVDGLSPKNGLFRVLTTNHADGTAIASLNVDLTAGFSTEYGAWKQVDENSFHLHLLTFTYDRQRLPSGHIDTRIDATLTGRNTFNFVGADKFYDLKGSVVLEDTFTGKATRIEP